MSLFSKCEEMIAYSLHPFARRLIISVYSKRGKEIILFFWLFSSDNSDNDEMTTPLST